MVTYGKADTLSRLPVRPDNEFDKNEKEDNTHAVNEINTISLQLKPFDPCSWPENPPKIQLFLR